MNALNVLMRQFTIRIHMNAAIAMVATLLFVVGSNKKIASLVNNSNFR
jgi:hypothetical protein